MSQVKSFIHSVALLFVLWISIVPLCAQSSKNGKLVINSSISSKNAFVFINGEQIGSVPLEQNLKAGEYSIKIVKQLYNAYDTTIHIRQGQKVSITPELEIGYVETTLSVNSDADIYVDGEFYARSFWKGALSIGRHTIECKQGDHNNSIRMVNVQIPFPAVVELEPPTKKTGKLMVNSSESNASVFIDNEYVGVTPLDINDITVGEHVVTVTKEGYNNVHKTVHIDDINIESTFVELIEVVNLTITSNPTSANLKITGFDGNITSTTPCSTNLEAGSYTIQLDAPKHERIISVVKISGTNNKLHFRLKPYYMKGNEIYVRGEFQYGGLVSAGASVGGYLKNINAEFTYLYGFTESDNIYWNSNMAGISPVIYRYKATLFGGSLGYGIVVKKRLRFTPQIGLSVINCVSSFKEFTDESYGYDSGAKKTYSANLIGSVKFEYAITSFLGICVVPNYSISVNSGKIYEQLSNISTTIKNYSNGFNIRAGVYIYY